MWVGSSRVGPRMMLIGTQCSNLLAGFEYCVAVFGSQSTRLIERAHPTKSLLADATTTSAFPGPTTTGASLVPVYSMDWTDDVPCWIADAFLGGDFPQGIGYVMATPNMTVVPVTATGTTTYASTATPSPTVAPGTVTDGCLQCE